MTSTSLAVPRPSVTAASSHPLTIRARIQQTIILVVIVAIALWARVNYAESAGFVWDLRSFAGWMRVIQTEGILNFYQPEFRLNETDRTYPPLSTVAYGLLANAYGTVGNERLETQRPAFIALLKVMPIACDILLIVAVYLWLSSTPQLQRAISIGLALYPALIVVSAWWGQVDSMFTLFLVLALIALNRDRPLWAWAWFTVALLLKQPAMFFAPLILVLTFRRYGWRKTAYGIALCAILCLVAFAPFIFTSGVQSALSPYLQAGDTFPYLTNNAYNTWYAVGSVIKQGAQVVFMDPELADSQLFFAGLSYKLTGLIAFGAFNLMMMVVFWRKAAERREFLWGAVLYMGMFMLPTQVHERYLYPTAIFALIAVVQDHRLWWVALGFGVTFTYNIMAVLDEGMMRDLLLAPADVGVTTALVNLVLFAALIVYTMRSLHPLSPAHAAHQP